MPKLGKCIPNLPVRDCPATMRWYIDVLGFQLDWDDAVLGFDHTMYCSLSRDDFQLCLDEHNDSEAPVGVFCYVDDVQAIHDELRDKDVEIVDGPTKQPWGDTDMTIRDPNGHLLSFSQPATGS